MLARSSRFGTFLANSEKQKNDENFYTGSVRTVSIFLPLRGHHSLESY